jgi:hypothetical protein
MQYKKVAAVILVIASIGAIANADEKIVRSGTLPGASIEQEITYHPSLKDYETARDERLALLKKGDKSAYQNPADGPWMQVETTAKIGIELKGVGVAQGRKNLRQITAAEEALYIFEHQKD